MLQTLPPSEVLGWLNFIEGSLLASLIVSMIEVPLGFEVGLNAILFFHTKENNLSSSALEWK